MRVYAIILLLLTTVALAGHRSSNASLEMKLTKGGKPFAKQIIQVRYGSIGFPGSFETKLTTDDAGTARINLSQGSFRIQLEAKEIEEHSFDVTIKEGETSTVEIALEPVEEIEFVRLPKEELAKLQDACIHSDFWKVKVVHSFANEQQWKDAWSAFKQEAPAVDFKKWRVVGFVLLSNYVQPPLWVRRVTYNPKTKTIRTQLNHVEHGGIQLPAFSCRADFVLIPARDGIVQIR